MVSATDCMATMKPTQAGHPPDVRQVKPDMSELQTRMSIGQKIHANGGSAGDLIVTYDQNGKHWTLTYVNDRATAIKCE
jgi:hypothetical protein